MSDYIDEAKRLLATNAQHPDALRGSLRKVLDALDAAEARLLGVHVAAPAALGPNVLEYAPLGSVLLTQQQRGDIQRELDARTRRISDLKHAMGEGAGWFDRFSAERARAEAAEARLLEGERDRELLRALGVVLLESGWRPSHAPPVRAVNDRALALAKETP